MSENGNTEARLLGLEPEDLDGYSMEELADYVDAGREPADPAIDSSPGCRIALDALERLRLLTPELLAADAAAEPELDEGWVQGILAGIALDARAGRRIPIRSHVPDAELGITEGAVRGLVRAAENTVPGVLVGRCVLDGDIAEPGAPVIVRVGVSVAYGKPIHELAELLCTAVLDRLRANTELHVVGVDIDVQDVQWHGDDTVEDEGESA